MADLKLTPGSRVVLLVNNLGGSAAGEIGIVAGSATRYLAQRQISLSGPGPVRS